MLRERMLGNSPTRLVKQLRENHGEGWLDRLAHYMEECAGFVNRPSLLPVVCQKPPKPSDVTTSKWLLSVYGRDIISRIDHIKASITSTFVKIKKMDNKTVKQQDETLLLQGIDLPDPLGVAAEALPTASVHAVAPPQVHPYHSQFSPATSCHSQSVSSPSPSSLPQEGEMSKTIPVQDQRWITNTLFHSGKLRPDLKLWYESPVPALIYHQTPTPDRLFTHQLMVWMPYHQWKVRMSCPVCCKNLTGYGVHERARKVLDIDRYYLMETETLRCTVCSLNYLSTSQTVQDQLDLPHQKMFRLILTRKYACDIRVIRLLRDRTLGNSPARLVRQLKENHREEWLNRLAHYLGECFVDRPSLFPVVCQEPPEPINIPTSCWLLSVYGRDILCRIDHIEASITLTFGTILKMDSTKKEGPGLDRMVAGVMERYRQAAVPPPVLLYVDCGCCISEEATRKLQTRFGQRPDLNIQLDIWHFMRRLAVGCTTDAHPLYPTFMGCLSACIFEWNAGDLSLLRQAKRKQLMQEGVPAITDLLVDRSISKKDLSLYCRRRTRGEEATIRLIERLVQELGGALWVCHSWTRNQCQCTEFPAVPPGRPEQVESGSGDCSSDQQASTLLTYSGDMAHCVNTNSLKVFGELLGVDYLLNQTGQPLVVDPNSKETENMLEDVDEDDEGFREDETHDITMSSLIDDPSFSVSSHFLPSFEHGQSRSLAEYLVELRIQPSLALTNQQVSNIVAFWQNLLDYDKQRVVLSARYQSKCSVPSIKVQRRGLAQCPDGTVSRWDLILGDYRKIRQRILANATVMQQTTLQLVDVSHTTLVQWHNRRVKRQDSAVLMQGLHLPSQLSVAADPLLPAYVRPPSAPPQSGPAHQYHLLSSTVGQAHVKRNIPSVLGVLSPPAENP
ncbi:hypothetical protein DPX16_3481 [Anabarilius grahami]|uniref:DUF6729 domain-containing protein n=1 Tax=Anabarilius grahami TaxID=495550 RepID=A0A3N0XKQ0_ANAGA|nr:hypothetical protein DPX16_3481 [Anabarilius grahami]